MPKINASKLKKAEKLVNKLTENGEYRGYVFVKVDALFGFPKNTMAKYFGKKESTASKRKKRFHKNYGCICLSIEPKKGRRDNPHKKKKTSLKGAKNG